MIAWQAHINWRDLKHALNELTAMPKDDATVKEVADLKVLSELITDACAAMKVQVQLALKATWNTFVVSGDPQQLTTGVGEVPDISDLFAQDANQPNTPAKETSQLANNHSPQPTGGAPADGVLSGC